MLQCPGLLQARHTSTSGLLHWGVAPACNTLSPVIYTITSLFFQLLLKCPLLRDAPPGHPVENSQPCPCIFPFAIFFYVSPSVKLYNLFMMLIFFLNFCLLLQEQGVFLGLVPRYVLSTQHSA